jgi:hypothetical protein
MYVSPCLFDAAKVLYLRILLTRAVSLAQLHSDWLFSQEDGEQLQYDRLGS